MNLFQIFFAFVGLPPKAARRRCMLRMGTERSKNTNDRIIVGPNLVSLKPPVVEAIAQNKAQH